MIYTTFFEILQEVLYRYFFKERWHAYMWIYSPYITKNGKRLYAKTADTKYSVFGLMMIKLESNFNIACACQVNVNINII